MNDIEQFCGPVPDNFKKLEIASDPNFVFENDQNYNAVQLYDYDGNTVFVNSFIECEYYVTGGWDNSPIKMNENDLQFLTVLFVFGLILLRPVIKKVFN